MLNRLYYKLDENNKPVECSMMDAEDFFDNQRRIVKQERVSGCKVSTVFLVINHNAFDAGPPVLFETMIFTNRLGNFKRFNEAMWRYTDYDRALASHNAIVEKIKRKELSTL